MPAIWTAPLTWTAGDIVTAAQLNTHMRDNLEYLRARIDSSLPTATTTSPAGVTTLTGTTFTQVLALSHTYSFAVSHNLMVWFVGSWRHTTAATGELRFTFNLGGTNIGDATYGVSFGQAGVINSYLPFFCMSVISRPAASSVVIQPRAATNGGSMDIGFGYVQFGYAVLAPAYF